MTDSRTRARTLAWRLRARTLAWRLRARTLAWRLLLAASGGWIWSLQFERIAHSWAPWISLIPLLVLLGLPNPGRSGWIHGAVFWLTSIPWIVPTLVDYGQLSATLAWPLMVGVGFYLGSYWAVFGWLGAKLWRYGPRVQLLAIPALWVGLEWLRGALSDFPWNLAAYAVIEVPGALPLSAWIGALGVSWVLVTVNVAVLQLTSKSNRRLATATLLGCSLLFVAAGRWGAAEHSLVAASRGGEVRILQPNIPNRMRVDGVTFREIERLATLSADACDAPGSLVVWPESGGWPLVWNRDPALTRAIERTTSKGCSVLFNSTTADDRGSFNSAYLVSPSGEAGRYDKRRLVPFGEYVPLRGVFGFIDSLARNAGDYQAASEVHLLPWAGEEMGLAVCFEITFPSDVAVTVDRGATILATLTNDAWYGDSSAPWQHLRSARFRAAENRRPLLRAAITGVSALVDGRGQLVDSLGVGEEGVLAARITGRRDLSPFTRHPHRVPLAAVVILVLIGGGSLLRSGADKEGTDR